MVSAGKHMDISLKIDSDSSRVAVYRTSSDSNFGTWTKIDTEVDGDVAKFKATSGGVYVAKSHNNSILIVALAVSAVVILALVLGGVWYFRKNPAKWSKLKNETKNVKRNFNDTV
jgi:hypothetical protein